MAENKTKPTKVSAAKYIADIGDEAKRADAKALVKLLQDVTGEKAAMWGPSIVGFGSYHYKYDSGREGDMPLIGFSPRKQDLTLYVGRGVDGALLKALGKHKLSGGCLHIKRLSDVDLAVLEKVVSASVKETRRRHR